MLIFLEGLTSLGSHMSHLHRKFGVPWFVHNPEGLGDIHAMMSSHVHELGTETDVLHRCGKVGLIALIQDRM